MNIHHYHTTATKKNRSLHLLFYSLAAAAICTWPLRELREDSTDVQCPRRLIRRAAVQHEEHADVAVDELNRRTTVVAGRHEASVDGGDHALHVGREERVWLGVGLHK